MRGPKPLAITLSDTSAKDWNPLSAAMERHSNWPSAHGWC